MIVGTATSSVKLNPSTARWPQFFVILHAVDQVPAEAGYQAVPVRYADRKHGTGPRKKFRNQSVLCHAGSNLVLGKAGTLGQARPKDVTWTKTTLPVFARSIPRAGCCKMRRHYNDQRLCCDRNCRGQHFPGRRGASRRLGARPEAPVALTRVACCLQYRSDQSTRMRKT